MNVIMHVCKVASVVSYPLQLHGLQPCRLLCPRDSLGKNTERSCHALLQGIFPTQGLNSHLLYLPSPTLAGEFFTNSTTWEAHMSLSVQFSHSEVSDSLQPHGLQHARPPCPSPTPRVDSTSCPLNQ